MEAAVDISQNWFKDLCKHDRKALEIDVASRSNKLSKAVKGEPHFR